MLTYDYFSVAWGLLESDLGLEDVTTFMPQHTMEVVFMD